LASLAQIARSKGLEKAAPQEARDRLKQVQQGDRYRKALSRQAPPRHGVDLAKAQDDLDGTSFEVPVTELFPYEHNPRKATHEAYQELKESIRAHGILQALTVTRRPGDKRYLLYAGGNTRLQIIQELWAETGDARYERTRVVYRAWRGEAWVLVAHLAENNLRSDMSFWDKARGIMRLKAEFEAERGAALSIRQLEAALKEAGYPVSLSVLSSYRFATETLAAIGPHLSGLAIRTIQPRFNSLKRVAERFGMSESDLYGQGLDPIVEEYGQGCEAGRPFEVQDFLGRCDRAVAEKLALDPGRLARVLEAIEQYPELAGQALNQVVGAGQTGPGGEPPVSGTRESANHAATPTVAGPATRADAEPSCSPVPEAEPLPQPPVGRETPDRDAASHGGIAGAIDALIRATGLAQCHVACEALPLGYYMGFPAKDPLDLHDDGQDKQLAWWLLATLSGQMQREWVEKMPECPWRKASLEDEDAEAGALEILIQHNIGSGGDLVPLAWLTDPGNYAAGLCLEVIRLHRERAR
jgi:ParB family protein of integrating conjugative element (PFGI_1 class)